jgi:hypothetical protein
MLNKKENQLKHWPSEIISKNAKNNSMFSKKRKTKEFSGKVSDKTVNRSANSIENLSVEEVEVQPKVL